MLCHTSMVSTVANTAAKGIQGSLKLTNIIRLACLVCLGFSLSLCSSLNSIVAAPAVAASADAATQAYNEANKLSRAHHYKKALAKIEEAIRLNSKVGSFYYSRANIKASAGVNANDDASVFKDLQMTLKLDPKNKDAHMMLYSIYCQGQKFKEALAEADALARLVPYHAAYFGMKGRTRIDLGDYQGAIVDLSKAIELAPYEASYYIDRADMLVRAGRPQEAIKDYDKGLALNYPRREIVLSNKNIAERMVSTERELQAIRAKKKHN